MLQGAAKVTIQMKFPFLATKQGYKNNAEQDRIKDLIAQAFPTTCRHQYKTVFIIQCSTASFILQGPKTFVAKDDSICKIDVI
jgi:hypothetical protein